MYTSFFHVLSQLNKAILVQKKPYLPWSKKLSRKFHLSLKDGLLECRLDEMTPEHLNLAHLPYH